MCHHNSDNNCDIRINFKKISKNQKKWRKVDNPDLLYIPICI